MYFAKNLRYLRRRAEWSQSDLGDRIATDYNTISRYESGKSTPKLEALARLAQVFGVGLEELRSTDLTVPAAAQWEGPGPVDPGRARPTALAKPARHPLTVLVELDGTAACLERVVARLAAINGMVADTE